MKKFYKEATYKDENGLYLITLDGRTINTPANNILVCQSERLARAICDEWNAQDENIVPDKMPLTQYCYTALDYIPKHRSEIINTMMNFLDTDLVCYRTDDPADLGQLQAQNWDPFIDWFESHFDYRLATTTGLSALKHDNDAHERVLKHVHTLDHDHLTIAQSLTATCGSLVMALRFIDEQVSSEDMFNAAFVEELYQGRVYDEDRYGIDPNQEKQRAKFTQDINAARIFLDAVKSI